MYIQPLSEIPGPILGGGCIEWIVDLGVNICVATEKPVTRKAVSKNNPALSMLTLERRGRSGHEACHKAL